MRQDQHKILDCTIRDGGLINNWDFSVEFVQDMYRGLSEAGVEYMEIGYKNSEKLLEGGNSGPWRFLNEDFLKDVITKKTDTKLSALVDIGRVDENDILPREQSLLDLIRVACYIKDLDKGLELVQKFHNMGYETSLNIMALSHVMENELIEGFEEINKSPVDVVYIVDSYGSMDYKDIDYLATKFQRLLPKKELGIHMHNNLQLAYSNTIIGASKGVTFLDSSVYGMGRAAGNCPTELLVSYLKNPRYDVRPVLGIIERHMLEMREKWMWGYLIPYMIVGSLDEHPRVAMAHLNSPEKDKFLGFYDKLTSPEVIPTPE
ncbi:aldolase catalytic domain-containing protein [Paenibacillus eucommiae]|uniref:4-hydroxy 2-oxovalerate aldolase n=1 Tax=Paenibacillus eucommiae TaxID=1355755 RepID=A0ABS4IZ83_9BACL|nr:aldolase catalytic domain-containing protein [Paenibacillus eucommiae]MBP1992380.1 4-hydroxy 2-oxovalerate aldolase [Paenibacillus eucommiae]